MTTPTSPSRCLWIYSAVPACVGPTWTSAPMSTELEVIVRGGQGRSRSKRRHATEPESTQADSDDAYSKLTARFGQRI